MLCKKKRRENRNVRAVPARKMKTDKNERHETQRRNECTSKRTLTNDPTDDGQVKW